MRKLLNAHSTFEVVVEVHQHPCGSAILANNLSSLANPLGSFCSTQSSTEQSNTETKLTYSTESMYAFNCTSGQACDIIRSYTAVTNSLSPKTRASGWTRIITARSVSRGMPQYCLHSLVPVATLSSPVTLLFGLQEILDQEHSPIFHLLIAGGFQLRIERLARPL